MAIAKEKWDRAKVLFELGYSLSDIYKDTGITTTSISKKAKLKGWIKAKNQQLKADVIEVEKENSTLIEKKSIAIEKIKDAQMSDFEITVFNDAIRKELKNDALVFDTATLALIRNNEILTRNKKTVMLKVQQYGDNGSRVGEDYEPYEIPLSPSDIKDITESTDKASVTLKVNERHAPKTEINNTNQQAKVEYVGFREITDVEREKALEENGRDITS